MLRGMLLLVAAAIFAFSGAFAADMPDGGVRVYNKAPRHGRTAIVRTENKQRATPRDSSRNDQEDPSPFQANGNLRRGRFQLVNEE